MDGRRGLTALPSRRGRTTRTRTSIDTEARKRTTTRPIPLPVSSVQPHRPIAVTTLSPLLDLLPITQSIRDIGTRPFRKAGLFSRIRIQEQQQGSGTNRTNTPERPTWEPLSLPQPLDREIHAV
jgi:hypothetical protein